MHFEIDLAKYYSGLNIEALRWYDRWLKGVENGIDEEPPIYIYSMNGTLRMQRRPWKINYGRSPQERQVIYCNSCGKEGLVQRRGRVENPGFVWQGHHGPA